MPISAAGTSARTPMAREPSAPGLGLNAAFSGHVSLTTLMHPLFNLHNVYQNWDVSILCVAADLRPALPGKLNSTEHRHCI